MSYIPLAVQTFTPTTGQTITVQPSEANIVHVVIDPASTFAALTITMPTPIYNQKFIFSSTQILTVVVITGSLFPLTSLGLNATAGFLYNLGTASWFKVQ